MTLSKTLQLMDTDFGKSKGWIILRSSMPIGELHNCRYSDMFWDAYDLSTEDTILWAKVRWDLDSEISFRSIAIPDLIVSGNDVLINRLGEGTVVARFLYGYAKVRWYHTIAYNCLLACCALKSVCRKPCGQETQP